MLGDDDPLDAKEQDWFLARETGSLCPHGRRLALRLARDELWDAEIRRQAVASGLPVVTVDGSRDVRDLADDLAARFRLG